MEQRYQNAEQIKQRNIEKMGPELGAQYTELWQRVVRINVYWAEFIEMFGTKPGRLDMMNRAAPAFFHMLRTELSDMMFLHLSRLTDKPEMGKQKNLTIRNLPSLIKDGATRTAVEQLVKIALEKTEKCRERRNRRIAHDDLWLALNDPKAKPLDEPSKIEIDEAVQSIGAVLQAVNVYYFDADMIFKMLGPRIHGFVELLYIMHDGLKAREEWEKRLRSGRGTDDDFNRDEL